jgi:uncharacterized Zn finger protein
MKYIIEFVECDNCEEDGIINNEVYMKNKSNLTNLKCWNCGEVYILDEEYTHKTFSKINQ